MTASLRCARVPSAALVCVNRRVTVRRLGATRATSHHESFSTVCFLHGQHLAGRAILLSASGAHSCRGLETRSYPTREPSWRRGKNQKFPVHWGVAGRDCLGPVVCTPHHTCSHHTHSSHTHHTHSSHAHHTPSHWHPFTSQSHTQLKFLCRVCHVLTEAGAPFPCLHPLRPPQCLKHPKLVRTWLTSPAQSHKEAGDREQQRNTV